MKNKTLKPKWKVIVPNLYATKATWGGDLRLIAPGQPVVIEEDSVHVYFSNGDDAISFIEVLVVELWMRGIRKRRGVDIDLIDPPNEI